MGHRPQQKHAHPSPKATSLSQPHTDPHRPSPLAFPPAPSSDTSDFSSIFQLPRLPDARSPGSQPQPSHCKACPGGKEELLQPLANLSLCPSFRARPSRGWVRLESRRQVEGDGQGGAGPEAALTFPSLSLFPLQLQLSLLLSFNLLFSFSCSDPIR